MSLLTTLLTESATGGGGGGSGDVNGPAISTTHGLTSFADTTGKNIESISTITTGSSTNSNTLTGDGTQPFQLLSNDGAGSNVLISSGRQTGTNGQGSNIAIIANDGAGSGDGGPVEILAGSGATGSGTGDGGDTYIQSGAAGASGGVGGDVRIAGGNGPNAGTGDGGTVLLTSGDGGNTGGDGGTITIAAGDGVGGTSNGGDIILTSGAPHGAGTAGVITLNGVDPTIVMLPHFTNNIANASYWVFLNAPFSGRINSMTAACMSGTCQVVGVIQGVTITMTPINVSIVPSTELCTGANVFNAGDYLQLAVSFTAAATNMQVTFNITRLT